MNKLYSVASVNEETVESCKDNPKAFQAACDLVKSSAQMDLLKQAKKCGIKKFTVSEQLQPRTGEGVEWLFTLETEEEIKPVSYEMVIKNESDIFNLEFGMPLRVVAIDRATGTVRLEEEI